MKHNTADELFTKPSMLKKVISKFFHGINMKILSIKNILIILLFMILSFGIYSNTFEAPFYFDDEKRILNNPSIRIDALGFKSLQKAAFGKKAANNRPLPFITFALNYYFHKYDPAGYHVVNIIIHVLTSFFLYLLLKLTLCIARGEIWDSICTGKQDAKAEKSKTPEKLQSVDLKPFSNSSFIALSATLVWLVHPLHIQSVTYIVQRMNSMAAMFFVLSLFLYVKGRLVHNEIRNSVHSKLEMKSPNRIILQGKNAKQDEQNKNRKTEQSKHKAQRTSIGQGKSVHLPLTNRFHYLWFAGSILSWIMALGSKQTAATLPLFVFLYEWYFFQNLSRDWLYRYLKYFIGIIILFSLLGLLYLGMNPWAKFMAITDYAHNEFSIWERGLTQFRVVIYYLGLIFYPHPSRLNFDYDFTLSHSLINPITTLLSLVSIIGLLGLSYYLAKRERLLSFCILWFLGNLVIESSIIPLAIIFEHRTYLPSMLVVFMTVILIFRYLKHTGVRVTVLCAVVLIFSFWTYDRNNVWSNPVSLWEDNVAKSPNKARPYYNLGLALMSQDKIDEAIEHYTISLKLNPNRSSTHNNLGLALEEQGKTEEAIEHYKEAIRIRPDNWRANCNLGLALVAQGQTIEAIGYFEKALHIKPDNEESHYNLGYALMKQGRTDDAIKYYAEALCIKPDYAEAHSSMGMALAKTGRLDEAIRHYLKAISLNPELVEAHNNLGVALSNTGRLDEAIKHFNEALRMKPDHLEAHNNLGAALSRQGHLDEAMSHLNEVLKIQPDHAEAHNNLGIALSRKEKFDEAITHFNDALRIKPDYAEAHNNLGIVLSYKGRLEEAVEHLKMALQIKPDYAQAHNNMGIVLTYQGGLEEAIIHFTEALRIEPDYAEARNNLQSVSRLKDK